MANPQQITELLHVNETLSRANRRPQVRASQRHRSRWNECYRVRAALRSAALRSGTMMRARCCHGTPSHWLPRKTPLQCPSILHDRGRVSTYRVKLDTAILSIQHIQRHGYDRGPDLCRRFPLWQSAAERLGNQLPE